jgi:hypothetical protein
MDDVQLMYRACGAETRDDYLRFLATENGLPISAVQRLAEWLGEKEDFGALVCRCEIPGGVKLCTKPNPNRADNQVGGGILTFKPA